MSTQTRLTSSDEPQSTAQVCQICGGRACNRIHSVREMMLGSRDKFRYLECHTCGCLQLIEFPEDLARYYPSGYTAFGGNSDRGSSFFQKVRRQVRKRRNQGLLKRPNWIDRYLIESFDNLPLKAFARLGVSRHARILDVGCGSGILLMDLKELGYENLLGLDRFLPQSLEDNRGVKIVRGELQDLKGTQWDVIMFHHSFEHMSDPLGILRLAAGLQSPDGRCLIRVPVLGWAWEHYGVHWAQLDAPRHLYLHTIKSFRLLAAAAGFDVVDVSYDSNEFQFWASELYSRDIDFASIDGSRPQKIFSKPELRDFKARSRELNAKALGDSAVFNLRKS